MFWIGVVVASFQLGRSAFFWVLGRKKCGTHTRGTSDYRCEDTHRAARGKDVERGHNMRRDDMQREKRAS